MKRLLVKHIILPMVAVCLATFVHAQIAAATLVAGDAPPPVGVARWIKGEPVNQPLPGTVYLFELTNRGCLPCRLVIPHLSSMSTKFEGKAKVVSVYVNENRSGNMDSAYVNDVERYIKSLGEKVQYTVAVDRPDQFMFTNWTKAAGYEGYPYVFLVDKDGKIAWIGTATDERLETILQQLIEGKSEVALETKTLSREQLSLNAITEARTQKKYREAIALIDELIKEFPGKTYLTGLRFDVLLDSNASVANAYGYALLQRRDIDPDIYNGMAGSIRYAAEKNRVRDPDWRLAVQLVNKAYRLQLEQSPTMAFEPLMEKANIYFVKGAYKKAVQYQQKGMESFAHYHPGDVTRREGFEEDLAKYEKALIEK